MEKNRIRALRSGDTTRISYSKINEVLEMPNLIEVQKNSYQWFLDEGLKEVFEDIPHYRLQRQSDTGIY